MYTWLNIYLKTHTNYWHLDYEQKNNFLNNFSLFVFGNKYFKNCSILLKLEHTNVIKVSNNFDRFWAKYRNFKISKLYRFWLIRHEVFIFLWVETLPQASQHVIFPNDIE